MRIRRLYLIIEGPFYFYFDHGVGPLSTPLTEVLPCGVGGRARFITVASLLVPTSPPWGSTDAATGHNLGWLVHTL